MVGKAYRRWVYAEGESGVSGLPVHVVHLAVPLS
jgi:hypothetical protein